MAPLFPSASSAGILWRFTKVCSQRAETLFGPALSKFCTLDTIDHHGDSSVAVRLRDQRLLNW